MYRTLLTTFCCLVLTSVSLAQQSMVLILAPNDAKLLTLEGGKIVEVDVPIYRLDGGDNPDKPDPTTLHGAVVKDLRSLDERAVADGLYVALKFLATNIESGKYNGASKAQLVDVIKSAAALSWQQSSKPAEWQAAWDRWWAFVQQDDRDGKITSNTDYAKYLNTINKANEDVYGARAINWDKFFELILKIIELLLKLNPMGGIISPTTGNPYSF